MLERALPGRVRAVLKKIAPVVRKQEFYLAGGSGLALQIGHRISEDLDFFKAAPFDSDRLFFQFRDVSESSEQIMIESRTLVAVFEGVRCSFFHYGVPLVFSPLIYAGVDVADWRDILAEKFKTISQRACKKDFFDVFAVMRLKSIAVEEAVSLFRKRFESTGINLYHVLRSLTYFEEAEGEPDPVVTGVVAFSWEEVKSFFVKHTREFEEHFSK